MSAGAKIGRRRAKRNASQIIDTSTAIGERCHQLTGKVEDLIMIETNLMRDWAGLVD
jgi:hypothetical protein